MKRVVFFLFLFLAFLFVSAFSWSRDLIIAGIPEEPLRWLNSDGKLTGLDVDIIDYVMKKLKIPYKIELVESGARLDSYYKDSPPYADIIFTFSYTDERAKYVYYPKESHISFNWNFFYLKENKGKYVFNTYNDLAKWKIGITKGNAYSDDFLKAIKEVPLEVDEITTNSMQLDKLLAKRFDLVPLNTKATLYEAKMKGIIDKISYLPKPIKDKEYFNIFIKASTYPGLMDIAQKYDVILKKMKQDGTLKKILAKYGIK